MEEDNLGIFMRMLLQRSHGHAKDCVPTILTVTIPLVLELFHLDWNFSAYIFMSIHLQAIKYGMFDMSYWRRGRPESS